jgi:predicted nuclease of predicted toxin-antitoxin system
MKFLIDAQLPHRLKLWLAANSCDAIHTDDLPARN